MYNPGGDFYGTTIDGSLRFVDFGDNNGSNHYLSRTPSSAGSSTTWTWSGWVKRAANLGSLQHLFSQWEYPPNNQHRMFFGSDDRLTFMLYNGSSNTHLANKTPAAQLRDVSAWYHIVFVWDTTNGTADDRMRIYINGVRQTTFASTGGAGQSGSINPSSSLAGYVNNTGLHTIGTFRDPSLYSAFENFDGYMADINFIDGTALDASSFGETKSGIWIPKEYSGSYGTNGFHLEFAGNANDTSGNGNNFTTTNISAHDYMLDSPTNNFCVMNSLHNMWYKNMSQGGLRVQAIGSVTAPYGSTYVGTIGVRTGKWYWEYRLNTHNNGNVAGFIRNGNLATDGSYPRDNSVDRIFGINNWDNAIYVGSPAISKSFNVNGTAGDIMGITYDADNNTFSLYKNGSFVGTSATNSLSLGPGEHALPMMTTAFWDNQMHLNFGQDSTFAGATTAGGNADENGYGDFKYAPPSGYLAICTANLPDPAIDPAADDVPEDYFDTVLYTAATSNGTYTHGNLSFRPDLTWIKNRNNVERHFLIDVIRGNTSITDKYLVPNSNALEGVNSTTGTTFSVTNTGYEFTETSINSDELYFNGRTYVGWNWKAGGTGVSNTDGSITSTVSANTDAGFSIATYTGNATAGATVGHGLGVAPDVVLIKARARSGGSDWPMYHRGIPNSETGWIRLNLVNAWSSTSILWNNTAPSSSVVTLGSYDYVNDSGTSHVMYSFAEKEGYSKFGSFTGNGSSDGGVVYTGFRPAFVMVKRTSSGGWHIFDNKRAAAYNVINVRLEADNVDAENTGGPPDTDLLSNGFKFRTSFDNINASGGTYIYMAFAEQPFKYANAR